MQERQVAGEDSESSEEENLFGGVVVEGEEDSEEEEDDLLLAHAIGNDAVEGEESESSEEDTFENGDKDDIAGTKKRAEESSAVDIAIAEESAQRNRQEGIRQESSKQENGDPAVQGGNIFMDLLRNPLRTSSDLLKSPLASLSRRKETPPLKSKLEEALQRKNREVSARMAKYQLKRLHNTHQNVQHSSRGLDLCMNSFVSDLHTQQVLNEDLEKLIRNIEALQITSVDVLLSKS
eukprot:TRINITY_DN8362_c0_g1_i1.p1 TRINITY_DN8362_c0_g1~~TRINITY_DN8362_c0_g1_i1.p1  ORF type:complete len:236 (+),score=54.67 TRINITY_DN8362_c0_g1_i1:51-758(+)